MATSSLLTKPAIRHASNVFSAITPVGTGLFVKQQKRDYSENEIVSKPGSNKKVITLRKRCRLLL